MAGSTGPTKLPEAREAGARKMPEARGPIYLLERLVCTRAFKMHGFWLCLDVGYDFRLVDFGWWI